MNTPDAPPVVPKESWQVDLSHLLQDGSAISVDYKRAAQMTSLSQNTIKRLAQTGKLRTTRIGRRRIVPIEALRELVRDGIASIDR